MADEWTKPAGRYRLNGSMVTRDDVPPGVDPLLIPTHIYNPGDIVELTAEQATRLSAHHANRDGHRYPAIEPYEDEQETEGDDGSSAAKVPSLSKKD